MTENTVISVAEVGMVPGCRGPTQPAGLCHTGKLRGENGGFILLGSLLARECRVPSKHSRRSMPATLPPSSAPDPYDPPPTLWQRRPHLPWAIGVFAATVFLTFASFPPLNLGEAAYAYAIGGVLWAFRQPPFRLYAATMLGASVVAWIALLGWLHNVTLVGVFLLGPFVGLLNGVWFLAVWWVVPKLKGHLPWIRILVMLGLAATWVLLEWVRGWIFGGFPWLPLAASQWERPLVLQAASLGGASVVTFVLVMFNLGAGAYAHRIFFEGATGLKKRSPEFMAALLILAGTSFPLVAEITAQQRHRIARVAVVQPYIPQNEKWDPASAPEIMRILEDLTVEAAATGNPDFVVWPEAVTPWALLDDPNVEPWLESISRRVRKPILLGVVVGEPAGSDVKWWNRAIVVDPVNGVQLPGYSKRHLVPFGEYIPIRPVLGWLEKFVRIGGDFIPGDSGAPLVVPTRTGDLPMGVLICFEDIFPDLGRDSVLHGAEMLTVVTNNGWFGEGGAAAQHAAHSVLRAVELRRPVLRCGNGGWSGWIDEYGHIRAAVKNEEGRIFFRGHRTLEVTRDVRWAGRPSFYTEHGDWFIVLSASLAVFGFWLVRTLRPPVRPEGETAF